MAFLVDQTTKCILEPLVQIYNKLAIPPVEFETVLRQEIVL